MRGKQLIKLLKALELFSKPEGTTIEELSEHLNIDRRSVYRVKDVIEELGFPIYDDQIPLEKKKRWKLEESYLKKLPNMKIPDLELTLSEIISLYLLKSDIAPFRGTEIEKNINSALGKISHFVPNGIFAQLDKIKALFVSSSKFVKDYSGKEAIIDQLTEAMLSNKTCLVQYHSFYDDKTKSFKIDPLNFFENDGGLYIFVNTTSYDEIRTLAVERILELDITDASFEYPEAFDPETLLETAFDLIYDDPIEVKIWFPADQARYIKERKWSTTQQIEDQDDGSIVLSMKTSGWWDVKRWVMSFGARAEVLEPEWLRTEIRDELKKVVDTYQ